MFARLVLATSLSAFTMLLASCSDETTTPTSTGGPDVVERPTTAATARTTTAASVWAMNDLAALAAHWADGDLRSAPARFADTAFDDLGTFDEATTTWTLPLTSDFRVGPETYRIHGSAAITYLAAGVPVADPLDADAMRADVTLDVLPRLERTLQRDLEMSTHVELLVDDLGTRPLALAGTGATMGRDSLVDDDTNHRSTVDMQWSFSLSDVYRDCCASGVIDLRLDGWRSQVSMDGEPTVATRMVIDEEWVEDVGIELPCVLVQESRGTSLQSAAPLLTTADGNAPVLDVVSSLAPRHPSMGPRTSGALVLEGTVGDRELSDLQVPIERSTTLVQAFAALRDATREAESWYAVFGLDEAGRVQLDNSVRESIPSSTRHVTLWGNLDSRSEAKSSLLVQTQPLLAAATVTDDLRFLHTGADGGRLELTDGDVIVLTGRIAGLEIADQWSEVGFEVGETADGTTVGELRAWLEHGLRANGAPGATVTVGPDGSFGVANVAGDPPMEEIRLQTSGRLDFNQAMLFGNLIRPGSSQRSASALLSPAEETDVVSDLFNGDGEHLNFQFPSDGSGRLLTSLSIGGTRGGAAITPTVFLVEEGVTPLAEVLRRIEQAFGISNATGAELDGEGRLRIEGDPGRDGDIGNVVLAEEGNLFSNLYTSMDFTVIRPSADATPQVATVPVYDSLGATHELQLTFTKRPRFHVWDWVARIEGDAEIIAGERGTVRFDERGHLTSFLFHDGIGQIRIRPQPEGAEGAEVVAITIDPGDPGTADGLTQYAAEDVLQSVADGFGYVRPADALEIELRLVTTDGVTDENVLLARFDEVRGGDVASSAHVAVAARPETTFDALVTTDGTPVLAPDGGSLRTLDVFHTVDGATTRTAREIDADGGVVGELLVAIAQALDAPVAAVSLGADGRVIVDAPHAAGAITSLRVRESGRWNPAIDATLDFEVTAQASAGCR